MLPSRALAPSAFNAKIIASNISIKSTVRDLAP